MSNLTVGHSSFTAYPTGMPLSKSLLSKSQFKRIEVQKEAKQKDEENKK